MEKDKIVIIIPAYNPDEELLEIVKELKNANFNRIVVVNDGSIKGIEYFRKIGKDTIIIEHKQNRGQGTAVKTGIQYCLNNISNIMGVITMDADGQHLVEDVNKICEELKNKRDSIILGSRNFKKKNTPFRSKLGNSLMTKKLKKKTGITINDTQTGLRAIPYCYLKEFENIESNRFDFAIDVILYCIQHNIPIEEYSIQTVYINKNKNSHYRVIKDTLMIYKKIRKYNKHT